MDDNIYNSNGKGVRKMKRILLLMTVLLLSAPVHADEWTTPEAGVYAVTIADYLQTRQIRKRDDLEEAGLVTRKLCGRNPKEACLLAWVGFKLYKMHEINNKHILRNAPMFNGRMKWKTFVNSLYLGVHLNAVNNNLELGLKVRF